MEGMSREDMREALTFASDFFQFRALMAGPNNAKLRLNSCEAACRQAIKLLDAQEPRLLTAEDFHGNPDLDDGGGLPCWKEARKETRRSGWAVICYGKWLADTEGGVARYWTRKPSEEQRRDTPWKR